MPEDEADPLIPAPECGGTSNSARRPAPIVTSEEVLRGGREIQIRHGEERYWLRVTRNGKLILTK
jgi:hemin uptake protein HemP